MDNARANILNRLRAAQPQLPAVTAPGAFLPMVPQAGLDWAALVARFIHEARQLNCVVHEVADAEAAVAVVVGLIADQRHYVSWDDAHIPVAGFAAHMAAAGLERAAAADPQVQTGITGVDAALAATGSLVLMSGPGKPRSASLLPVTHIAILESNAILPDLETWFARQQDDNLAALREASNVIIISGPSRTADIGMELILGAHGPRTVHIVLLKAAAH